MRSHRFGGTPVLIGFAVLSATFVAAVTLESGCTAILGIADIVGASDGSTGADVTDGEADGGPLGDGSSAPITCAADSGLVPQRGQGGVTCVDPSWAEWPMPNGTVDVVKAGAPNPESYAENGDGTITDNVTGLMWQKLVAGATDPDAGQPPIYTQAQAVAYCSSLTLAGHHDWRLPSVIELTSLTDPSSSNPAIHTTFFPGVPTGPLDAGADLSPFWSSTPFVTGSDPTYCTSACAWGMGFQFGNLQYGLVNAQVFARCVR